MSNKQIVKKVFDEVLGQEKMKRQILSKYEKKEKKISMKKLIPICSLIIVISGIGLLKGKGLLQFNQPKIKLELSSSNNNNSSNEIILNKIEITEAMRIDADIKTNSLYDEFIPWLEGAEIILPKDLNKLNSYSIYGRKDKTSEYNLLNCYVYEYEGNKERSIRIAFSEKNKPVRDYYFKEDGAQKSTINGVEFIIYQYEERFFTAFKYKEYNFDIETNKITLEELTSLLTSIIK